jgi:hypothetical protein
VQVGGNGRKYGWSTPPSLLGASSQPCVFFSGSMRLAPALLITGLPTVRMPGK